MRLDVGCGWSKRELLCLTTSAAAGRSFIIRTSLTVRMVFILHDDGNSLFRDIHPTTGQQLLSDAGPDTYATLINRSLKNVGLQKDRRDF